MLKLTTKGQVEYLSEERADEGLRRYWQAKSSGDSTAAIVRVNASPHDDDPDLPTTPAGGVGEIRYTLSFGEGEPEQPVTSAGEVSKLAAARIKEQERWLTDAGFAAPIPLFAPGTRVTAVGDANFRLERERVEEMPPFDDVAGSIIDQIKAEDRQDVRVNLRDLTMSPRGPLFVGSEEEYALEPGAFTQLATLAGFGAGARYLRELCNPDIRSANVNWQLTNRPDRPLMLRTRKQAGGRRSVFAAVSPSYAAVDTDRVLETIRPALRDARAELVYDGTGIRGSALWMPDVVQDLAAGDVFKVGVRLHTNDIGKGRIVISAVVWRNLCLNLLIIGKASQQTVSQVHRGNTARIFQSLADGVREARENVSDFLDAWGHARQVEVQPAETIAGWIDTRQLEVKGERDKNRLVRIFLDAWAKEPGRTLADTVNAVTRAAHEHEGWTLPIRESLEQQAAELVYVRA